MGEFDIAEIISALPDVQVAVPFGALEEVGNDFNMPFGRDAITIGDVNLPFGRDALDLSITDSNDKTTTVSDVLDLNLSGMKVGGE